MENKNNIVTFSNLIIIITIIAYIVQESIQHGSFIMGLNLLFLKEGFYHQIVTTMFAHGGLMHLTMNMLVLFQFGNIIENTIGKIKFLILYFVGGILTSILSFAYIYYFEQNINIVGASGAISVLLGFVALRDKFNRKGIIIWMLLISFAPLLLGMNIAWYSHLIGFVLGFLIGFIL
jgi:membrane associated rhomboid family serine protease